MSNSGLLKADDDDDEYTYGRTNMIRINLKQSLIFEYKGAKRNVLYPLQIFCRRKISLWDVFIVTTLPRKFTESFCIVIVIFSQK